jgi:hypothetical protein
MVKGRLRTEKQQSKLPWQIEWIWHVHRLHPLEYLNDCTKQLSHRLVDKQTDQRWASQVENDLSQNQVKSFLT